MHVERLNMPFLRRTMEDPPVNMRSLRRNSDAQRRMSAVQRGNIDVLHRWLHCHESQLTMSHDRQGAVGLCMAGE
jgi:hypothetical protein